MFTRLSLRLRVFLFFCFLAAGAVALAGGAMYIAWSRATTPVPSAAFVSAILIFAFLNTGLVAAIWILFDEHVAKPINTLASSLRLRAHSDVKAPVSDTNAKYLDDLAPAANAVTETLTASLMGATAQVARETERLKVESARLTALLTEIPVATILLNSAKEIVLYDGQAADVLSQVAAPRLKAPLSDYFDLGPLNHAMEALSDNQREKTFTLKDHMGTCAFDARLKSMGQDGHVVLIDAQSQATRSIGARPLVFDFDLIASKERPQIMDTPLNDLSFVVIDTETTGLSVETDEIVQIGAVRSLNGRLVDGEILDTFVNPGRPIPPSSTRIHKVTDAHVTDAPDVGTAGRALHHFARDAVLVAHNAPFDIGLLRRCQTQMNVTWDHPVLDTVLLSAEVFGTTEVHSLDALCERLLIAIPENLRHTALGDAQATGQVLVKLLPLLQAKGIATFGALVEASKKHGRLLQDLN